MSSYKSFGAAMVDEFKSNIYTLKGTGYNIG